MMKKRIGILLVTVFAVLILMINLVTASYSWFSPQAQNGAGMSFMQNDGLRSESCNFSLYDGGVSADASGSTPAVTYGNITFQTLISSDSEVTVSTTSGNEWVGLHYFRVKVVNSDQNAASNVSLYIKSSKTIPQNTTIGVVKPTNSFHKFTSATNGCAIVRNAYVKKNIPNEADAGTIYIDFYVRCEGSNFTFGPGDLELLYN